MIVEFFGMPGAGKTTAVHRAAEELGLEVIRISSRLELVFRNILFFAARPVQALYMLGYIFAHSQRDTFWYKLTNLFLHPNAKYQKAMGRKEVVIIDQGYYQTGVSLFETAQDRGSLERFIRHACRPDFLIVVTVSPEIRARRLAGRQYVIRTRNGEAAFQERLRVMELNLQKFIGAPELLPINHAVIDGDGSKDTVYQAVAAILTSTSS